jgi:hypothetical protein
MGKTRGIPPHSFVPSYWNHADRKGIRDSGCFIRQDGSANVHATTAPDVPMHSMDVITCRFYRLIRRQLMVLSGEYALSNEQ